MTEGLHSDVSVTEKWVRDLRADYENRHVAVVRLADSWLEQRAELDRLQDFIDSGGAFTERASSPTVEEIMGGNPEFPVPRRDD